MPDTTPPPGPCLHCGAPNPYAPPEADPFAGYAEALGVLEARASAATIVLPEYWILIELGRPATPDDPAWHRADTIPILAERARLDEPAVRRHLYALEARSLVVRDDGKPPRWKIDHVRLAAASDRK